MNNLIAPEIVAKCMDPVEQEKIDQLMVSFLSLLASLVSDALGVTAV